MNSSNDAARVYVDNRTMGRIRLALQAADPALAAALVGDTAMVRYVLEKGLLALRQPAGIDLGTPRCGPA